MNLFPYASIRTTQKEMMGVVSDALEQKRCAIIDAPTGIGKTAGVLAPALDYGLEHGKTIFFLTSRHTQHHLVVDTVKQISRKHGKPIIVADLIGKKHMCAQDGVDAFRSGEFLDHCKRLRDNSNCAYYENFGSISKPTPRAQNLIMQIAGLPPMHTEQLVEQSKRQALCPYEIGGALGAMADLIVCDYSLIFHPQMRDSLLKRTKKELAKAIVIIDEAHNLSSRLRDMMSAKTSMMLIDRCRKEAAKILDDELVEKLNAFHNGIAELAEGLEKDKLITRKDLLDCIEGDEQDFLSELRRGAALINETKEHSFLGGLAEFLDAWMQQGDGFVRVMSAQRFRKDNLVEVRLRCLDPALWTEQVISGAHSVIAMSGTLHPTFMHKDVLGFPSEATESSYPSPFPEQNRKCIIVPDVSTKFERRSPQEFDRIARACAQISNSVPGNVAIFFPSYNLRNEIHRLFHPLSQKRFFLEMQDFSKKDKANFLEEFKASSPNGVLLGVAGGNFSEGVDIEGNILKAVIVVGLPLEHPDLETQSLIEHYERKFGRGWEYGYLLPAFNRTIQAAGRCIRSEKDRGIICLLDERYAWPKYKSYLPKYWNPLVTRNARQETEKFFMEKIPSFNDL